MSASLIAEAEDWIVGLKLAILALFVGVGFAGIDPSRIEPAAWAPPLQLAAGGMIIFLAYEGFELIANTGEDIRDPRKTLPRAYYLAVGIVIVLYVLVALVAVGGLSLDRIVAARDYALAEAARPFLGQGGFALIAVAAMLSTASAINATLYGAARLTYSVARDGELPEALERQVWGEPIEGLLITAALTLFVANAFNLSSIAMVGSAGFLLIFAAVNIANATRAKETNSRAWISVVATVACLVALGALVWQTAVTAPAKLWVLAAMLAVAVLIEGGYRLVKGRRHALRRRR
jgi:amino acid transporter